MIYVLSSEKRKGRNEIFIGNGSVFEQRHRPVPHWWPFKAASWPLLCEGYIFTQGVAVACGLYKTYFRFMLSSSKDFSASFYILVGLARQGDLSLICDCKSPGSWHCHGSVIKSFIIEELRKDAT